MTENIWLIFPSSMQITKQKNGTETTKKKGGKKKLSTKKEKYKSNKVPSKNLSSATFCSAKQTSEKQDSTVIPEENGVSEIGHDEDIWQRSTVWLLSSMTQIMNSCEESLQTISPKTSS